MQNVHSDKHHCCNKCGDKFAFEWQLKYHTKHCGIDLICQTCAKRYDKRSSLAMHCKRNKHDIPIDLQTSRMSKKNPTSNIPEQSCSIIYVPILVSPVIVSQESNSDSLSSSFKQNCSQTKFRNILPKTSVPNILSNSNDCLKETQTKKRNYDCIKRSAECQTVTYPQVKSKNDTRNIETQTIFSSFDGDSLQSVTDSINDYRDNKTTTKCSSFTQTFLIDDNDLLDADPFFNSFKEKKIETPFHNSVQQSVQTDDFDSNECFDNFYANCSNIQTQTHITSFPFDLDYGTNYDNVLFDQTTQTDEFLLDS